MLVVLKGFWQLDPVMVLRGGALGERVFWLWSQGTVSRTDTGSFIGHVGRVRQAHPFPAM